MGKLCPRPPEPPPGPFPAASPVPAALRACGRGQQRHTHGGDAQPAPRPGALGQKGRAHAWKEPRRCHTSPACPRSRCAPPPAARTPTPEEPRWPGAPAAVPLGAPRPRASPGRCGVGSPRSAPTALCLSCCPSPRPAARHPQTPGWPPALTRSPVPMPGRAHLRPAMDVGRPRRREGATHPRRRGTKRGPRTRAPGARRGWPEKRGRAPKRGP